MTNYIVHRAKDEATLTISIISLIDMISSMIVSMITIINIPHTERAKDEV